MEISNPIASQYIANQGLASKLNAQGSYLPVKSDAFSLENPAKKNIIDGPKKADEQVRQEEEGRSSATEQAQIQVILSNPENPNLELLAQQERQALQAYTASGELASATPFANELSSPSNPTSSSINNYLEVSALNQSTGQLSQIDFFI